MHLVKCKPNIVMRKLLLLLCLAYIFSIIVLTKYIMFKGPTFASTYQDVSTDKRSDVSEKVPGFNVFTSTCHIPDIDPFHESILKFVEQNVPPMECLKYGPLLTYTEDNKIFFNENHVDDLLDKYLSFTCCYRALVRVDEKNQKFIGDCKPLVLKTKKGNIVDDEFVFIKCDSLEGKLIYKSYHALVLPSSASMKNPQQTKYNVLIVGMDGTSRLNFHRHMKNTKKFLKSIGVIELTGYNKVGDNTFPNLMPIFTGMDVEQLKNDCWYGGTGTLDNCPFVWKDYKAEKYATMMAEDTPHIAAFNFEKKGFRLKPTDHYLRPIMIEAERDIGYEETESTKICLGPMTITEFLLRYTKDFLKAYQSTGPTFGFTWINSMTHDLENYASKADPIHEQFFKNISALGMLKNTVIIYLSDHGKRFGDLLTTHVGKLESRLPYISFHLPKSFKNHYPEFVGNLRKNAHRLTTPFDVYATLKTILVLSNDGKPPPLYNNDIDFRRPGISLFYQIPENRTCSSANIPTAWCTCQQSVQVDKNTKDAKICAWKVVEYINSQLIKFPDGALCHQLQLLRIKSVRLRSQDPSLQKKDISVKHYSVTVETLPARAIFEAVVKKSGETFKVYGNIGRLNLYGNQSICIHTLELKKFCYCR